MIGATAAVGRRVPTAGVALTVALSARAIDRIGWLLQHPEVLEADAVRIKLDERRLKATLAFFTAIYAGSKVWTAARLLSDTQAQELLQEAAVHISRMEGYTTDAQLSMTRADILVLEGEVTQAMSDAIQGREEALIEAALDEMDSDIAEFALLQDLNRAMDDDMMLNEMDRYLQRIAIEQDALRRAAMRGDTVAMHRSLLAIEMIDIPTTMATDDAALVRMNFSAAEFQEAVLRESQLAIDAMIDEPGGATRREAAAYFTQQRAEVLEVQFNARRARTVNQFEWASIALADDLLVNNLTWDHAQTELLLEMSQRPEGRTPSPVAVIEEMTAHADDGFTAKMVRFAEGQALRQDTIDELYEVAAERIPVTYQNHIPEAGGVITDAGLLDYDEFAQIMRDPAIGRGHGQHRLAHYQAAMMNAAENGEPQVMYEELARWSRDSRLRKAVLNSASENVFEVQVAMVLAAEENTRLALLAGEAAEEVAERTTRLAWLARGAGRVLLVDTVVWVATGLVDLGLNATDMSEAEQVELFDWMGPLNPVEPVGGFSPVGEWLIAPLFEGIAYLIPDGWWPSIVEAALGAAAALHIPLDEWIADIAESYVESIEVDISWHLVGRVTSASAISGTAYWIARNPDYLMSAVVLAVAAKAVIAHALLPALAAIASSLSIE